MSELTRDELTRHLREMAEAKQSEIYYAYRDAVLAHDAALRAKVEALEQEVKEEREISEWYGALVKRAKIGTKETPSLRAYIEQTESQLATLTAENNRLREVLEAAADFINQECCDHIPFPHSVENDRCCSQFIYAALRGEGG